MFKPLSLFLGWRYTRAKKRQHFVSFISLASMLGIGLGVMVLITVLSVMNGFDFQIRSRFFAVAPQVTVIAPANQIQNNAWHGLQRRVAQQPAVVSSAPFVTGNSMLIVGGQMQPLRIMGILPDQEVNISKIASKMVQGKLSQLKSDRFRIILGQTLADQMNLRVGDRVNLVTPRSSVTLAGTFPVYRQFTVSGIFHTTGGFAIDNVVGYVQMQDAAKLFGQQQSINGLHLKIKDVTFGQSSHAAVTQGVAACVFSEQLDGPIWAFFSGFGHGKDDVVYHFYC